jgi:hypothetical protein
MIPLNPYVLLGGVCGVALLCAASFGLGHHQKTLEDASAALAGARKAVVAVQAQGAVTSTVDQHVIQATAQTQATTNANLQKLPIYITRAADERCIISRGAIGVLDASAHDVPVPAISLPDADSGVQISELVADETINAGNYRQLAERLRAWDEWFDGQKALAR